MNRKNNRKGEERMFIVQRKPKLRELQSVFHFLIVASSLSYGYGTGSAQTIQHNSDGDPVAKILGRINRRPRHVEKLQSQSKIPKSHVIPSPVLIRSEKTIYIGCQGSTTIH